MNRSHTGIERWQKAFGVLLLFCLLASLLSGCARLTTTFSTFTLDTNDEQIVDAIVHSSFIELGFYGGHGVVNKKEQIVYTMSGRSYLFNVTYRKKNEQLIIKIGNTTAGASQSKLAQINEDLSKIAEQITKKLEEGNIKATVETKSYWIPESNML